MKLELLNCGRWRGLMSFPFSEQNDVQRAAVILFSQSVEPPSLRIHDGIHVIAKTKPETVGGVLVWENVSCDKGESA